MILDDLGVGDIRLLTNNPDKIAQLERHGVHVAERVPLVVGVAAGNEGYLETKAARMGHLIAGDLHVLATSTDGAA
jgi:3,4-dihydroxy 2-butanone 4-phosphate synthase/GTP cyclohydrolase II